MFKVQHILFWVSGLAFGLMVCAYFSCPHWELAMPVMLLISIASGRIGFKKIKE